MNLMIIAFYDLSYKEKPEKPAIMKPLISLPISQDDQPKPEKSRPGHEQSKPYTYFLGTLWAMPQVIS